jgi:hypothetical protein
LNSCIKNKNYTAIPFGSISNNTLHVLGFDAITSAVRFIEWGCVVDFSALIKSRRFWATVASVVVVVGKDRFSALGIDEAMVTNIVIAIGAWVVGESFRSSELKGPTDVA